MNESATYVYCIVHRMRRPAATKLQGVPDAGPARLLALSRSAWAVAADVPLAIYGPGQLDARLRDLDWVSRVAVGHAGAVERFAKMRDATVVPLKVFTLFSDDERAVRELDGGRRQWLDAIRRIKGCTEWGVRLTASTPAPFRGSRDRVDSGTAFLAEKKRARDEARARALEAARAAEDAYARLSRVARETRRREAPAQATHPPLLDAAFLVPADSQAKFHAAVSRAAHACRQAGADLVVTGPWPAYNFVQGVEAAS